MQTLLITAQYFENYNDEGLTPRWKPKGGARFKIVADTEQLDCFVYNTSEVEEVVKKILASKSDNHQRFELVDIERQFSEPENITEEFKNEFEKHLELNTK